MNVWSIARMADDNKCKVYVGSLHFQTSEEGLSEYFQSTCGGVIEGKVYIVSFVVSMVLS